MSEDGRGRLDLGHLRPHAGSRRERRDRGRRRRPLPPLPRGRRADARARALGVPVLDRLAARPAGRPRPGERARARLLPAARRRAARGGDRAATRRSSTGTCRRSSRTRAAGRRAKRRYRFAEYAGIVFDALGDRVRHWLTLNEPWCAAFLGYGIGRHAPGIHDGRQAVAAAHHLMLAHGLAVARLRATQRRDRRSAIVLNVEPHLAGIRRARGRRGGAARRRHAQPHLPRPDPARALPGRRARPPREPRVDLGHIHDGDLAMISAPLDVLGVNYYRPDADRGARRAGPGRLDGLAGRRDDRGRAAGAASTPRWAGPSIPGAFENLLLRLGAEYGGLPDASSPRTAPPTTTGSRRRRRARYRTGSPILDSHLHALHRALEAGVDVRGYFVWSLLDNFEWAEGYSKRFGIVYIDYETLERIPKESARWYARRDRPQRARRGRGGLMAGRGDARTARCRRRRRRSRRSARSPASRARPSRASSTTRRG